MSLEHVDNMTIQPTAHWQPESANRQREHEIRLPTSAGCQPLSRSRRSCRLSSLPSRRATGQLLGLGAALLTSGLLASDAMAETALRYSTLNSDSRVTERHTHADDEVAAGANSISADFLHGDRLYYYIDEVWVADIGTLLYRDADNDGYYTGFSLTIDVDSRDTHREIYLTIATRQSDGSMLTLHQTGDFTIHGDSLTDEYRVDIELVQNFSADHYDISVDIHDAWNGRVLDTATAAGFSNLRQLPLEAETLDPLPPPANDAPLVPADNIRVAEYGGGLSLWWLLALIPIALRRCR